MQLSNRGGVGLLACAALVLVAGEGGDAPGAERPVTLQELARRIGELEQRLAREDLEARLGRLEASVALLRDQAAADARGLVDPLAASDRARIQRLEQQLRDLLVSQRGQRLDARITSLESRTRSLESQVRSQRHP